MTRLRPASPGDLATLSTLDAALLGHEAWSSHTWAADLAAATSVGRPRSVLVLEEDDDIVGYAVFDAGDDAELLRIAVVPSRRRRGVGTVLLEAVVESARAAGCARLLLEVSESNAAARALYTRHGFTEVGRRPAYYRDGSAAVVMAGPLAPPAAPPPTAASD